MRRFSIVLAVATVLASFNVMAEFDERYCKESNMMKLMPMRCVSCGIQDYYYKQGKEVVPSERLLAIMGVAARQFRTINAGDNGRNATNPTRSSVAEKDIQRILISQIQAYGFCTQNASIDWKYISSFITRGKATDADMAEVAKYIGFAGFKDQTKISNFRSVFDDGKRTMASMDEKRSAFRAAIDDVPKRFASKKKASKILKDTDEAWATSDCLDEMRETMNRSDDESRALCQSMVNSCGVEPEICVTTGMRVQAPSGQTRQGQPQQPSQPQPTGGGTRLGPPPSVQ